MIRASLPLDPEEVDLVDGFVFENAPLPWAITVYESSGSGLLQGFFETEEALSKAELLLIESLPSLSQNSFIRENLADKDWRDAYKEHFKPWSYRGFHLIPIWLRESHEVPSGESSLYLDPGMAFGTGNHESTRMCLEFLLENKPSRQAKESLLDLGCGSGILTLAASLVGYDRALGLDNDKDAIRISVENSELNGLQDKVSFSHESLDSLHSQSERYECVVANIQSDVLQKYAREIISSSQNKSRVILSGILKDEMDEIYSCFSKLVGKDRNYQIKTMNEWSSIQFQ